MGRFTYVAEVKREGPNVYVSGLPRTTTRSAWRYIYRLARVSAREAQKAATGMVLFGTGMIRCHPDREPEYVPFHTTLAL